MEHPDGSMPESGRNDISDALQPAKRARTDGGASNGASGSDKDGQDPTRTVFVGGVGPEATEAELTQLFSSYGAVASTKVIYDRSAHPPRCKGFAFVTFENASTADAVKNIGKIEYKGRQIDIGKPGQKAGSHPAAPTSSVVPSSSDRKVFVGNIPKEADESMLTWFFATFGTVEEVKLVVDQATGNRKGFGFVTFADKTSADSLKITRQADLMGRTMNFGDAVQGGKGRQGPAAAGGMLGNRGNFGGAGLQIGLGGWAGGGLGGFGGMGGPQVMFDPMTGQYIQSSFGALSFAPGAGFDGSFGLGGGMAGMGMGMGMGGMGGMGMGQAKANNMSFAAGGGLPAKTQLSVPEACVQRLSGPQGAYLNAMMMQSGAVLMLHPAGQSKSGERVVEISGTTPQVQTAQLMVSAIVASVSPTSPPERDPSCKVFLGGLSNVTDVPSIVINMFRFGTVSHAKIPQDPTTGRQRSYGFVTFVDPNGALLAKAERVVDIDGKIVEIKDAMKGNK